MNPAVLVGLGGVLGAVARHLVGARIERANADTFVVNVLGSFALGALTAAPVGESTLLVFGTGFCGAFTTFSSFAFETVRLVETGQARRGLAVAVGHLAGALAAVAVGATLAGALTG